MYIHEWLDIHKDDLNAWCKMHKYYCDNLKYHVKTLKLPIGQFALGLANGTYNGRGVHWMVFRPSKKQGRKWIQYDKYKEKNIEWIHFE